MASDWNEELEKYESGRSFGDDVRDSVKTACTAASLIVSKLPASTNKTKKPKDGFRDGAEGYGWYVGNFRIDRD
ncbi:hypothetical protein RN053_00850 [Pantoea dispersa]|uniref:hypothetical protein n=1 Tax=Pantoea TaxID=53335 RepID=UPI0011B0D610|nr:MULTISPECIES: hypothetical protein [Pantoea]MDT8849024.1 hypothetical protein [Pantoea dispersa]NIG34288.1 hypothetical protein [Pantoea sp. Ap-959]